MLNTEIVNEPNEEEAERLKALEDAWKEREDKVMDEKTDDKLPELGTDENMSPAGFCLQFKMLCKRTLKNMIRNPIILRVRMGQMLLMIVLLNLLYRELDDDEESVQNRNGLLFFITIFLIMVNI